MRVEPEAALERAIVQGLWAKGARRRCPPGAIVAGVSSEDREALRHLRAGHLQVRADVVALYAEEDVYRNLRMQFDQVLERAGRLPSTV